MLKTSFHDPAGSELLAEALKKWLPSPAERPVIICIGSDRHILDCLGPLTGTMLRESLPDLLLYGTLDQPLHARNLVKQLQSIRYNNPGHIELAIDASVGEEDEIGMVQFRQGGLIPGKALAKTLPAVGDFSLTGVVDTRSAARVRGSQPARGMAHVYYMAKLINQAVLQWHHL